MAPVLVILGRVAAGIAVGYCAKKAMEAYNAKERRKEAERAAQRVREAQQQHKEGLEILEDEFGDQVDEFTQYRLRKMIEEMDQ